MQGSVKGVLLELYHSDDRCHFLSPFISVSFLERDSSIEYSVCLLSAIGRIKALNNGPSSSRRSRSFAISSIPCHCRISLEDQPLRLGLIPDWKGPNILQDLIF